MTCYVCSRQMSLTSLATVVVMVSVPLDPQQQHKLADHLLDQIRNPLAPQVEHPRREPRSLLIQASQVQPTSHQSTFMKNESTLDVTPVQNIKKQWILTKDPEFRTQVQWPLSHAQVRLLPTESTRIRDILARIP